jgi:hypothetical protein
MNLMHLVVAVLSLDLILDMLIMKAEFTTVQVVDRAEQ